VRHSGPARAAVPKKSRPAKTGHHASRSDPYNPPHPRHPDEPSVLDARLQEPGATVLERPETGQHELHREISDIPQLDIGAGTVTNWVQGAIDDLVAP